MQFGREGMRLYKSAILANALQNSTLRTFTTAVEIKRHQA